MNIMKKSRISFLQGKLGIDLVRRIEDSGGGEARYERAYRYKLWKDKFPNGYER